MNIPFLSSLHSIDDPEDDYELMNCGFPANTGLSPSFDIMSLALDNDLPALDLDGCEADQKGKERISDGLELVQPQTQFQDSESNVTYPFRDTGKKMIGGLTYVERLVRLNRYREKRTRRVWRRKVSYECRKKVADNRLRIKGRFVTKADALLILSASRQDGAGN